MSCLDRVFRSDIISQVWFWHTAGVVHGVLVVVIWPASMPETDSFLLGSCGL